MVRFLCHLEAFALTCHCIVVVRLLSKENTVVANMERGVFVLSIPAIRQFAKHQLDKRLCIDTTFNVVSDADVVLTTILMQSATTQRFYLPYCGERAFLACAIATNELSSCSVASFSRRRDVSVHVSIHIAVRIRNVMRASLDGFTSQDVFRDLHLHDKTVDVTKVGNWMRGGVTTDFADTAILGLGLALLDLSGRADLNTTYETNNAMRQEALQTLAPFHRG
jgi:hypothetical protein